MRRARRRDWRAGPALAAVVTLLAAACSSAPAATASGASGRPVASQSASPTEPPTTGLELALKGIAPDASFSKETALAVFAASFGALPDVPASPSPGEVDDGTLAIHMVAAHWAELTDAQRAAIEDWIGTDPTAAATAAARLPGVLPAAFHPGAAADVSQAVVDQAVADIAAHVGHPLGIPIVIANPDPKVLAEHANANGWSISRYAADGTTPRDCEITLQPRVTAVAASLRFTLLHEVWHCFQGALVSLHRNNLTAPWLAEGEAQWVAEAITNGVGAGPGQVAWWFDYTGEPEVPLLQRSYDAVGFFAQLGHAGQDPWKLLEPMYAALASHLAIQVAHADDHAFLDQWGSSFFRDGAPSSEWAMTTTEGIPPASTPSVDTLGVQDDNNQLLAAPAMAAAIANLHATAFVTHVETIGSGRIADPAGGGIDEKVDDGSLDLCTNPKGDCTCPPGTVTKPTPRRAPQDLRVTTTGGDGSAAQLFLQGISKEKWCVGSALNLTVEGQIGGQRYSGLIVGYPAPRLTCEPLGKGNAVHWTGQAQKTKNQISGEFDMEFGTWTVGDAIGDRPISIFGGGSPRTYLGGISGTVTQTQTGGSIDATAANGADTIHVSGTWTCPGPSPAPSP